VHVAFRLGRSFDERWRFLAADRLKFRCYRCSQLLASAPGKAGSIVSCPRCKADLVVPGPDSPGAGDSSTSGILKGVGGSASPLSSQKPAGATELDEAVAGIPADLIDLRPEDLRVEAEFFRGISRASEQPREPEPAPSLEQVVSAPESSLAPAASVAAGMPRFDTDRPPAVASPPPVELRPHAAPTGAPPFSTPIVYAPVAAEIPAIAIDTPSLREADREFKPLREVVIPASAVLAWSLFGLIGIATSFIAGLMVGHYFWRG
jgi:hypothetical protein